MSRRAMKTTRALLFSLLATLLLCSFAVQAETGLSLKQFLQQQLSQHYQVWQLKAQHKAQSLALQVGKNYLKPTLSTSTQWQRTEQHQQSTGDNDYNSWSTSLNSSWTSPIGTQLELQAQRLNNISLGSPSYSDNQRANQYSIGISQPLLKHNSVSYNKLSLHKADNQWQQYLNQGELLKLELLRDGLISFIDFQRQHETWKVQRELLESIKKSLFIVERFYEAQRATEYDLAQAKLRVTSQQREVELAKLEEKLAMQTAMLAIKDHSAVQLLPLTSIAQLTEQMSALNPAAQAPSLHPELIASQLSLRNDQFALQQAADDHKPSLDLFFQHEKNTYQHSAATEENTLGIKLEYTFTNKSTRQQQAALKAAVKVTRLEGQQLQRQLDNQKQSLQQRVDALQQQAQIQWLEIDLAKVGLSQQLKRYQVGRVSLYSLEEREQDVLDKQLDWIATQQGLASIQAQLAYYLQRDIRESLD